MLSSLAVHHATVAEVAVAEAFALFGVQDPSLVAAFCRLPGIQASDPRCNTSDSDL
jgi:hypothetical protein